MPIDPSLMTHWRKRIGPDTLEEVLKATVAIALETEVVKAHKRLGPLTMQLYLQR